MIATALRIDDVDAAIEGGLLDADAACPGCSADCTTMIEAARSERLDALAARERYRAREARLQRRAQERAARRTAPAAVPGTPAGPAAQPALPPAAAAALARAKARAAALKP
ncbi:hypothetical protein [Novilysobacter selenitireducens]|uniref:hypothetical protein n=1 Tax=Novilysobacter selenitireducens TaxID=2872639 RepID=UPI001CC15DED|nr:hypothetical protein [Lysobacter selenitireducens]